MPILYFGHSTAHDRQTNKQTHRVYRVKLTATYACIAKDLKLNGYSIFAVYTDLNGLKNLGLCAQLA